MYIQQFITADEELLLKLNGSQSLFWDGFMWLSANEWTWTPVGVVLLYVLIKNNKWQEALLSLFMLFFVMGITDWITHLIHRFFLVCDCPAVQPSLMHQVDLVDGCRLAWQGRVLGHALPVFALAMFLSMTIRRTSLTIVLFVWALLNVYARIYLGVQYPGNLLAGGILGTAVGYMLYLFYRYVRKKYFQEPYCISNQYTSTGFLISDVQLVNLVFLLTLCCMIPIALYTVRCLYL